MKQGSDITNLRNFKEVLMQISTWHYSNFFYITLGEEGIFLKLILQFMTQRLNKSIWAILSVLKKLFRILFGRLTPAST